jgi:DNA mismatch endonuclease (patch repair protein)
MSRIRHKGMKPELVVRRLVHSLGFRYRLHRADLPGKPDLVFGPAKKIIFVHGCFWHQHTSRQCPIVRKPKSNLNYWSLKLSRNVLRDKQQVLELRRNGWTVLIVWECEVKSGPRLTARIQKYLGKRSAPAKQKWREEIAS